MNCVCADRRVFWLYARGTHSYHRRTAGYVTSYYRDGAPYPLVACKSIDIHVLYAPPILRTGLEPGSAVGRS